MSLFFLLLRLPQPILVVFFQTAVGTLSITIVFATPFRKQKQKEPFVLTICEKRAKSALV